MKSEGKPHRKLKVWEAGVDFFVELYREPENFPRQEQFGLMAQLRRAAVSIPSNIAEGAARRNTKELIQFLYIARGSLSEIRHSIGNMLSGGTLEKSCI